jgi:hypothetical protein
LQFTIYKIKARALLKMQAKVDWFLDGLGELIKLENVELCSVTFFMKIKVMIVYDNKFRFSY